MPHIIHISDTHFGPTPDAAFGGALVLPRFRKIVAAIGALDLTPDAVIHTGDVVDEPSEEAYRIAAAEMAKLGARHYYACGNHDDRGLIVEHLPMGEKELFSPKISALAYRVELEGHTVFVLDGCDTERGGGSQGEISDGQMKAFMSAACATDRPFSVFLHFPPLPLDCPWIDREMLLLGGDRFHEFLVGAGAERVKGVFFGHVHCDVSLHRDGIYYSGVGSTCCRIHAGMRDESAWLDPAAPIRFNLVSILGDRLLVREYGVSVSGPEG